MVCNGLDHYAIAVCITQARKDDAALRSPADRHHKMIEFTASEIHARGMEPRYLVPIYPGLGALVDAFRTQVAARKAAA